MGDFTDILNAVPEFQNPARRENYVDTHGLIISMITPLDGAAAVYMSSVQLQTTQGPVTITFKINGADSIGAACAAWQAAAREAIKSFGEKMKANERRIVLPGNPAANSRPVKTIN